MGNKRYLCGVDEKIKPKLSIVIPIYNGQRTVRDTMESLKKQTFNDFEIIVVDDGSKDNTLNIVKKYADKLIINEKNSGPAVSRNKGIKAANSDLIILTDGDVILPDNWAENMYNALRENDVIMGKINIPESTFIGDSISALGFPAGGSVGFNKIWKVNKEGYTEHASSCNMGIKKEIFEKYGYFDESFPLAGGEDGEFPYRITRRGVKIKYEPNALAWHEPRTSLKSFIRWQFYRGRSNYYYKKKVRGIAKKYIPLRIWSSYNIFKANYKSLKIFLITPLLFLSFSLQYIGYLYEKVRK